MSDIEGIQSGGFTTTAPPRGWLGVLMGVLRGLLGVVISQCVVMVPVTQLSRSRPAAGDLVFAAGMVLVGSLVAVLGLRDLWDGFHEARGELCIDDQLKTVRFVRKVRRYGASEVSERDEWSGHFDQVQGVLRRRVTRRGRSWESVWLCTASDGQIWLGTIEAWPELADACLRLEAIAGSDPPEARGLFLRRRDEHWITTPTIVAMGLVAIELGVLLGWMLLQYHASQGAPSVP